MISVEECQDFVPYGRQTAALHPRNLFGDPVVNGDLEEDETSGEWWEVRGICNRDRGVKLKL